MFISKNVWKNFRVYCYLWNLLLINCWISCAIAFKDQWNQFTARSPNKLMVGTFTYCSTAVKNTLFRAHSMPMYVRQIVEQVNTPLCCLQQCLSNFARQRQECVCQHQVTYFVKTFEESTDKVVIEYAPSKVVRLGSITCRVMVIPEDLKCGTFRLCSVLAIDGSATESPSMQHSLRK